MGAFVAAVVAYGLSIFHVAVPALALAISSGLLGAFTIREFNTTVRPALSSSSAFALAYASLHVAWHQACQRSDGDSTPALTDWRWPPIQTQPYAALCVVLPHIGAAWAWIIVVRGIEAKRRGESPLAATADAATDAAGACGEELGSIARSLPPRYRPADTVTAEADVGQHEKDEGPGDGYAVNVEREHDRISQGAYTR